MSISSLQYEPGWSGAFTRQQVQDAMPNGTLIVKANSEPEDANVDGTPGIILGSMSHAEIMNGTIFYFVEWASNPRMAVGVMGTKLRRVS